MPGRAWMFSMHLCPNDRDSYMHLSQEDSHCSGLLCCCTHSPVVCNTGTAVHHPFLGAVRGEWVLIDLQGE